MNHDPGRELHILLVEDNAADVRLLKEAMHEVGFQHRLSIVSNGEEAVDFVFRRNGFQSASRPDLILLDFNLPRKNGAEVLDEVKKDAAVSSIPIIVLTSSRSEMDVNTAYAKGANCYMRKPNSLDQIYDLVRTLDHYWFSLALLPRA